MALRIKSQWHREEAERSLQEIAGALAFNGWKIAMERAINLHGEHFVYRDDRQRLAVIGEYLIFIVQLVERLTHDMLSDDERRILITALALRLADILDENSHDLLGPGEYRDRFIGLLNQRSGEYAEFRFTSEGPSYPFLRHFGFEVQQLMGDSQENRWVIDQIMDKDGPGIYKQFKRIVYNLFD
ncbi:MAG TPA: hypothetical protein ENI96_01470 [Sedimenticola thiotaurini]|uniref:Uncharacterized protein n=1 Tax=Sedimenticola thiotaurini TaxID=1543721 RepID=A0A831RKH5_9GAMM|nr:hypothetical protein [Sedimenticola thiotaurini]